MKDYLNMIPPETVAQWIAAVVAILITGMGSTGGLIMMWFNRRDKEKEAETKIRLAELDNRLKDNEAKREREHLQMQSKLDETQSSRETLRLLFSEIAENRKEDSSIRASYERRENAHNEAMKEIAKAMQGIEANAAITLGILKDHRESDEIMGIKQEKIIHQNDTTHQRITELSSSLDTVILKVDSLAQGQKADKKTLEDIQGALIKIQDDIKHLEDTIKTPPVAISAVNTAPQDPLSNEAKKEE